MGVLFFIYSFFIHDTSILSRNYLYHSIFMFKHSCTLYIVRDYLHTKIKMDYRICVISLLSSVLLWRCERIVPISLLAMKLYQVIYVIFYVIKISEAACYHEYDNAHREYDVCLSIEASNRLNLEMRRIYLVQTPNNVDWIVLPIKYPNLEVSTTHYHPQKFFEKNSVPLFLYRLSSV
jgi:hypothetical protein